MQTSIEQRRRVVSGPIRVQLFGRLSWHLLDFRPGWDSCFCVTPARQLNGMPGMHRQHNKQANKAKIRTPNTRRTFRER